MANFYSCTTSFKPPNKLSQMSQIMEDRDRSHIEDLLVTMLEDQSDHQHAKFTDSYIKYRELVAEWMIDVTEYFSLHITTTHAAITFLDRLQPNEHFSRYEWQMLAICCIVIASKFYECEEHVPPLRRLEEVAQQTITNEVMLSYELWALKKMAWKLNARTPVAFLSSYIKLGYVFHNPSHPLCQSEQEELQNMLYTLATKCVVRTNFKSIPASALAVAITYYARKVCMVEPVWTQYMTAHMHHHPTQDANVIHAMELLCILDEDMCMWEEFMCTVQDGACKGVPARDVYADSGDSGDVEGDGDDDVHEICSKLNSMLRDFTSPDGKAMYREEVKRSPVSIAVLDDMPN